MKKIIITLFISCLFSQVHFNLNIDETGESTLIILQSSISGLQEGDEIGIFDNNGIINNEGDVGQILVGSGVWDGTQLEIVAIHSLDFSQFGGPILPGAVEGNEIVLKGWNSSTNTEYSFSYIIEGGSNIFNGLFLVLSSIECVGAQDDCGICYGPGSIYECGCIDVLDEFCDCYGNIEDCNGICNGNSEIDECGICDGDNSTCTDDCGVINGNGYFDNCGICDSNPFNDCEQDCNDEWGGDAVIDECGICDGDNSTCTDECGVINGNGYFDNCGICDSNPFNDCEQDCNEEWGGNAIIDECGICDGNGETFECEDGSFVCDASECTDSGGGDGGGGGGGENNECSENEILDCWGNCAPSSWLGDGYCDESMVDFNCLALAYDMGDCTIDFTSHVMPIINANCTGYCHSGESSYDGGLNLESYSNLMTGGNSGPAVIPYYPDYSLIIQKLQGTAPGSQMPPYGSNPLPENYFQTIYYWIEQGAIGSDDNDDGGIGGCSSGIVDCDGECVSESLLGDGNCDDGEIGEANFNCIQYIFDNTDCPIGNLDFGDYTYNINNNNGTIEVLMNCEFAVSNFEIGISGLNISGLSGGATENSNFNLTYTESSILGSSENQNIPPNSGLLTIIDYSSILENEVCFTNSSITTYNDITYEAILGNCIDATLLDVNIETPLKFSISNIYPNPFNPEAKVFYHISKGDNIEISIYDILGKKIKELKNSYHSQGSYELILNASGIPSGIYFIQINNSQFSDSKKFTIAK